MEEQMLVLTKGSPITPSFWLSLQNPETVLREKENRPHTPGSYVLRRLLQCLRQRNERGNLVVDDAEEEYTEVAG